MVCHTAFLLFVLTKDFSLVDTILKRESEKRTSRELTVATKAAKKLPIKYFGYSPKIALQYVKQITFTIFCKDNGE